jgi:hypothetical protein
MPDQVEAHHIAHVLPRGDVLLPLAGREVPEDGEAATKHHERPGAELVDDVGSLEVEDR